MKSPLPFRAKVFLRCVVGVAICLSPWLTVHAQSGPVAPLEHKVRQGDNLYTLAEAYLDDPLTWPALAQANGNPNPLRLRPGSILLIPEALLRKKPGGARVVHVSGTVTYQIRQGAPAPVELGMRLIDGDSVRTERNGFVTLEMADGSIVRVSGSSELRLERLKYTLVRKQADTRLELERGRVESRVVPQGSGRSRFQVDTPTMAAGVRGTEFGVTVNDRGQVSSDVLSGRVEVRALKSNKTELVTGGYGGALVDNESSIALAPLLQAPDLASAPTLQERPLIDLSFPALTGAAAYRAYIAPQTAPDLVAANQVASTPRLRFDGLDDGNYVVVVRAIDEQGIEGRPASHALRLKARPEPPVTMRPEHKGEISSGQLVLQWAQLENAAAYRLQLARDEAFTDLLAVPASLQAATFTVDDLRSGQYYWRVGTVVPGKDGQADNGPFGDPREFSVRRPVATQVDVEQNDNAVRLRWDGEEGQRYAVQIGRDMQFANLLEQFETTEPQVVLPTLEAGNYYLRIQASDADGFKRAFSQPQRFHVQQFLRSSGGHAVRTNDGQEIQAK